MKKETQKEKIERLENEVEQMKQKNQRLTEQLDVISEKLHEYQNKADNGFENSPHKKQLKERIDFLEKRNITNEKLLNHSKKREKSKDKEIERLQEKIQELDNKNSGTTIKNSRNAGRKPKLDEKQIQEVIDLRKKGYTITALSEKFGCSVGLVHKLINENSRL